MFRFQRLERLPGADLYRVAFDSEAVAAEAAARLTAELPELGGGYGGDEEDPLDLGEICCLYADDLCRVRVMLTRPVAPSHLETMTRELIDDLLPRGVGDDVPCEIRVVTGPVIVELLLPDDAEEEDDEADGRG